MEEAKKLRVSSATVASHLKDLEKKKLVNRWVDSSTYPPRVFYSRKIIESLYLPQVTPSVSMRLGISLIPGWLSPTEPLEMAKELREKHASRKNLDKYIQVKTTNTLSQLVGYIPMMIRKSLTVEGESLRYNQLENKEKARDTMDTIIDVYFRPLAHILLEFCYLTDPRDNKPLFFTKPISKELSSLENISKRIFSSKSTEASGDQSKNRVRVRRMRKEIGSEVNAVIGRQRALKLLKTYKSE